MQRQVGPECEVESMGFGGGAYQGTLSVAAINVESRQLLWMTAPAHARTIEVHLLPLGPFPEEMACHGDRGEVRLPAIYVH